MLDDMSDENRPIKITLTGKLSYADDITVSQAAQIIDFIDSSASLPSAPGPTSRPGGLGTRRGGAGSSDPRDALEASGAKTNAERIVAFALHISRETGKHTFKLDEIKPLFQRAREPAPGNISRDLNSAIRSGWVAESDTRGEFYVTDRAADVLETGFDAIPRSRATGTRPRPSGRRPRAPSGTNGSGSIPEVFAGIAEFSPTLEGYADYHKVGKKEKVLWAVNFAKIHDVPGLSAQEVVSLTDQLGDCIPTRDISGYFRRNLKDGYLNRANQDGRMRITPKGQEYLKGLLTEAAK
jgi:hypothetical protein